LSFVPPPRDFTLDPFQQQAVDALSEGHSVLVAAPTGSGKTLVAEHALDLAVQTGQRAFYTSPIKALANQKFRDFSRRYGTEAVGLLTGDNSIRGDASVVVMTTEVLRNMLYVDAPGLDRLGWVVLDEVHYLQDKYRGPVWEEVILHLDPSVKLVSLSATVSNIDQLGDWLETVRGTTTVVRSSKRPVKLTEMLAWAEPKSARTNLLPLFVKGKPHAKGSELDGQGEDRYRGRTRGGSSPRKARAPRRTALVSHLNRQNMAPVIYFIFSRAGCDDAAGQLADAGSDFTTGEQKERIRDIVESHLRVIGERDQAALKLDRWTDRLERGIASHHAGLVPAMKEAAETAFGEGLITVVFATETLALGINMPARTVVIENLSKFNGETHEILTPLQYTQLTGRAGRRGIDTVGYGVTAWSPFVTFDELTTLASSRKFELTSAFRPSYNMTVNLINRLDRPMAETIVGRSFAQFQVDANAVRIEQDLQRIQARITTLEDEARCDRGDVREYVEWVAAGDDNQDVAAVVKAMRSLRPGHVIAAPGVGHAVVLTATDRKRTGPRLRVVTPDGQSSMVEADDLLLPPEVVATVELPVPFAPKQPAFHRACADLVVALNLGPLSFTGFDHPVGECADLDAHLDALDEIDRMEDRARRSRRRLNHRSGRLLEEFDQMAALLEQRGYVAGWELTQSGELLMRLYHESDLLIAEAVREGLFDGLSFGEVAGFASCFTYEHRSKQPPPPPDFPTAAVETAWNRLVNLTRELRRDERHGLGAPRTREPEAGFCQAAFDWSTGAGLDVVLPEDQPGGDFVRNVNQLLDLLRQLQVAAPSSPTRSAAREAIQGLNRGVVKAATDIGALVEEEAVLEAEEAARPETDAVHPSGDSQG